MPDTHEEAAQQKRRMWRLKWPESCPYLDPMTMNAKRIRKLLSNDTGYVNDSNLWKLYHFYQSAKSDYVLDDLRELHKPARALICAVAGLDGPGAPCFSVLFVGQKRAYSPKQPDKTFSQLWLDEKMWRTILESAEVLPSFLEVLHTNNSANVCHMSYERGDPRPRTMHLGLKIGRWQESYEFAVYARQDLLTGRSFVLYAGTQSQFLADSFPKRCKGCEKMNVFHVLAITLELTYVFLENKRLSFDVRTQKLEERAGFSGFGGLRQTLVPPLTIDQIEFTKDLQRAGHGIRSLLWASVRFADFTNFLLQQLETFKPLSQEREAGNDVIIQCDQIKSALEQRVSLLQGLILSCERLLGRLDAQMNATRTLFAEKDTRITIEIGAAARRDSEIMRGIATVTIIFLPATFFATFFSMVFFQSSGSGLSFNVDRRIWIYPLVTIPLTIALGFLYIPPCVPGFCCMVEKLIRKQKRRFYRKKESHATQ